MIDLVVAGGGPVGLVTALHAARQGLHAVVIEPRAAPIDKACGEGLMPGAVRALQRLGVQPDGPTVRGIRYCAPGADAVADFPAGTGRGIRRTFLHRQLHDAAVTAGIDIRAGRVTAVDQRADHVEVNGLRARYLVGADGLHSTVRRIVGLNRRLPRNVPSRWGIRAHYAVAPWTDRVEVHWSVRAEAYVTPVAADCVGVALLGDERAPFTDRLRDFPDLAARLPSAPVARARAAGPLRQDVAGRVAGRVLLVGDSAGYVDALTGEGLALGFACAAAAVRRIREENPASYERDYRRITRAYRALTGALLWASQRPLLRQGIVPLASAQPWLFRRAVAALASEPG